MAKSFHDIIKAGKLEVDHKGETIIVDVPNWLAESSGILMDSVELTKWATEHEIIHGLLHAGIQKTLIDLRAKARPITDKEGNSDSILDDQANAQLRIDCFVVKPTPPPGSSANPLKMAVKGLKGTGMDLPTIVGILTDKFSESEVTEIFNSLK